MEVEDVFNPQLKFIKKNVDIRVGKMIWMNKTFSKWFEQVETTYNITIINSIRGEAKASKLLRILGANKCDRLYQFWST